MLNFDAARVSWWVKRASGMAFDAVHKVDTIPGPPSQMLGIESVNRHKAVPYDPSPWSTLRRSLHLASLRPDGLTFVDIGCGKGKVLLSALALQFRRVVGVEFSPVLCQIAEQNVSEGRFLYRRCSTVEIVCADAVDYPIPKEPTVFFFYNPFSYEIMEHVLGNIVDAHGRAARPRHMMFYAASSSMLNITTFLHARAGDRARLVASGSLGQRSINIIELGERPISSNDPLSLPMAMERIGAECAVPD